LSWHLTDVDSVHRALFALLLDEWPPKHRRDSDMPFLVHQQSLSTYKGRKVHKVAKQFLKLGDQGRVDVNMIRDYISDRIIDICDALNLQTQLSGGHQQQVFSNENHLIQHTIPFLIMDAYVLYRSLYYSAQHANSLTLLYVGGLHAESVVDFFINYMHMFPVTCHKFTHSPNGDYDRCVTTTEKCHLKVK